MYTLILQKDFRTGEREKKYFLYKNYTCLCGKKQKILGS